MSIKSYAIRQRFRPSGGCVCEDAGVIIVFYRLEASGLVPPSASSPLSSPIKPPFIPSVLISFGQ